jgi:small redox-active disulfide protein 2
MRINLKILGTGCTKCKALEEITTEVVKENGFDADIQTIVDIVQILNYHVMSIPALVINEKVAVCGRVPSKSEIKSFIENANHEE